MDIEKDVMHFKYMVLKGKLENDINIEEYKKSFSKPFKKFYEEFEATTILDSDFFDIDKEILAVIAKMVDIFRQSRETITDYDEDKAYDMISLINQKYYEYSDKERKKKRDMYLSLERAMRGLLLLDDDDLFKNIRDDYYVYDYFTNPEKKDNPFWNYILCKEIVYHTEYFLNIYPELYKDPEVVEKTVWAAEEVKNQKYQPRKTRTEAKTITKKMNNLKK